MSECSLRDEQASEPSRLIVAAGTRPRSHNEACLNLVGPDAATGARARAAAHAHRFFSRRDWIGPVLLRGGVGGAWATGVGGAYPGEAS